MSANASVTTAKNVVWWWVHGSTPILWPTTNTIAMVVSPAMRAEIRLNKPTTMPVVPTKKHTLSAQCPNSIRRNGSNSSAQRAQRIRPQHSRSSPTERVEPSISVARVTNRTNRAIISPKVGGVDSEPKDTRWTWAGA